MLTDNLTDRIRDKRTSVLQPVFPKQGNIWGPDVFQHILWLRQFPLKSMRVQTCVVPCCNWISHIILSLSFKCFECHRIAGLYRTILKILNTLKYTKPFWKYQQMYSLIIITLHYITKHIWTFFHVCSMSIYYYSVLYIAWITIVRPFLSYWYLFSTGTRFINLSM